MKKLIIISFLFVSFAVVGALPLTPPFRSTPYTKDFVKTSTNSTDALTKLGVTSFFQTWAQTATNAESAARVFTGGTTNSLYVHPLGDAEMAGDGTYGNYGIGMYEAVTNAGYVTSVRIPIYGNGSGRIVSMKMWQRPDGNAFSTATNTPIYSANVTLSTNAINTFTLQSPVQIQMGYIYITFEATVNYEVKIHRWLTTNSNRHYFMYLDAAGNGSMTGAGYFSPTYELISVSAISLMNAKAETTVFVAPNMAATNVTAAVIESSDIPRIILPNEWTAVIGDKLQIFQRGYIEANNPYNRAIELICTKGIAYPRYWEYTPVTNDAGSYPLRINVLDASGNTRATATNTIVVVNTGKSPTNRTQILCVGDSLTAGGQWPQEMYRRLTQSGGTPAGMGLTNVQFVGSTAMSSYSTQYFTGNSGWAWTTYASTNSPFYVGGKVDFGAWATNNSFTNISIAYFLLGWNHIVGGSANLAYGSNHSGTIGYAHQLIYTLHTNYPNAQIRLVGVQVPSIYGGLADDYGSPGGYANYYKLLRSVNGLNQAYQDYAATNSTWCRFVNLSCQFDSENNMPGAATPVNSRSTATEWIGNNGVHPDTSGYMQIGDAVYRDFIRSFCQ